MGSFAYPEDVEIVTTLPPSKVPTQSPAPPTTINPEDDAPSCHANESYCNTWTELYLQGKLSNNSANATCTSGTRVRCGYPPSTIELVSTPVTTFKVLSYNIWELGYLYYQNGQRERTCRTIPEVLSMHPDLDVIVFQEVFMGGCFSPLASLNRLTLREILTEYGFPYFTGTVGIPRSNPVKLENGGTFIASKWPILEESQLVFRDGDRLSIDVLMAKGVMYAKIEKTIEDVSKMYHVFGTHFQSGSYHIQDTIRIMQAVEMYDFHNSFNIPPEEPVIYAGDLNANRIDKPQHAADVIAALRSTMPRIVGDSEYTFDAGTNDVFWDIISVRAWLDYVLYSNEHEQPVSSTIEVVRPKAEAPMEVCLIAPLARAPVYADSKRCARSRVITNLADHYAVLGVLDYDQSKRTTTATVEIPASTQAGTGGNLVASIYLHMIPVLCFCLILI
ncbi:hypothetical protein BSL78_17542 [Apostichopus japonicus]|uniref:sphingomyelin phosphodiesterase n=1 Tax=Stichopus japonicus TaxID=307972 RepID=A0A2G8KC75_STIJA|nr:hypothetical protein BSL78_17542 [Apostichopus japonicus]